MARSRKELLEGLVWRNTHRDFKGKREDGTKVVLKYDPRYGTCSVPLSSLSEVELWEKLPSSERRQCSNLDPTKEQVVS